MSSTEFLPSLGIDPSRLPPATRLPHDKSSYEVRDRSSEGRGLLNSLRDSRSCRKLHHTLTYLSAHRQHGRFGSVGAIDGNVSCTCQM
jgi:hypothetical protein